MISPIQKILLIEDDHNVADFLRLLFNNHRIFKECFDNEFDIDIANTFKDSVDFLNIKEYDLIFLDLNLPDASGQSSLTRLSFYTDVPIIVVTGDYTQRDESLKNGAYSFFVKGNLNYDEFVRIIKHALKFRKINKKFAESRKILSKVRTLQSSLGLT